MSPDELKDLLKQVKYPGFSRDVVSFGLVRSAALLDGVARVALQITTADPQVPQQLRHDIEALLRGRPGVREIVVDIPVAAPKAPPLGTTRKAPWVLNAVVASPASSGAPTMRTALVLRLA